MTPPPLDLRDLAQQHRRLQRLAFALVHDEHEAEDVAQEAWLRALQRGPREPRALHTWLSTVAGRVAANMGRGRRRRTAREEDTARPEVLPSSAEIAARLELEAKVLAAVEALDEPHRTTLRDRYLGELSPTDLARRDGVPLDTVKSRLARARALLRARLEREGLGDDVHWTAALAPLLAPWHGASPAARATPDTATATPRATPTPNAAPLAAGAGLSTAAASLAAAITMKSLLLAAGALAVCVLSWQLVARGDRHALTPDSRSVALDAGPAALAPVAAVSPPRDAVDSADNAQVGEARTSIAATAGSAAADWPIRVRARLAGNRGGAAGIVVHATLHRGYEVKGNPLIELRATTGSDGAAAWPLADPGETVTISLRAEPRRDLSIITYDPVVVVRGEGPPPVLDVLVLALDLALSGSVRDEAGRPIAGAVVRGLQAEGVTAADGRFTLTAASGGYGQLVAFAPGYAETAKHFDGLEPGVLGAIEFVLAPGGVVQGVVQDEAGQPLAGAEVGSFGFEATTTSDLVGRYRLASLPCDRDGMVTIHAKLAGHIAASQAVTVVSGADPVECNLVLGRGVPVRGQVLDADGSPVAGAAVWVGRDEHAFDRVQTLTRDDGAFAFGGVRPERARIGASKAGHGALEQELEVREGKADVALTFPRPRTVRGRVLDEGGRAVSGVMVLAHRSHDYVGDDARTDVDGAFALGGLPAGPLTLELVAKGHVREQFALAAGQDDGVTLTLKRAGVLRGRVVDDATGAPLPEFVVRLGFPSDPAAQPTHGGFSATWHDPGRTIRDAAGEWQSGEFDEFEPGAYVAVIVSAPGYAPTRIDMARVSASEDEPRLEHRLVRPVVVELVVVHARTGAPLADAVVQASTTPRFEDTEPRWSARTDTAGLAVMTDVAPGALYVRVERAGRAPAVLGPFDVPRTSSRAVVRVPVPGGAAVAVTLRDADGAALPGREVRLEVEDVPSVPYDTLLEARSDAEGVARFEDVPAGRWKAGRLVRDEGYATPDLFRGVVVPPDAEQLDIELVVPGRARVHGMVACALKLPEGVVVAALAKDGTNHAAFVRDGRYELIGLAPGSYVLSAMHWDSGAAQLYVAHHSLEVPSGVAEVEAALALEAK